MIHYYYDGTFDGLLLVYTSHITVLNSRPDFSLKKHAAKHFG